MHSGTHIRDKNVSWAKHGLRSVLGAGCPENESKKKALPVTCIYLPAASKISLTLQCLLYYKFAQDSFPIPEAIPLYHPRIANYIYLTTVDV